MVITGSIYATKAIVVLVGGLYWERASSVGAMVSAYNGGLGNPRIGAGAKLSDREYRRINRSGCGLLEGKYHFIDGRLIQPRLDHLFIRHHFHHLPRLL